MNRYQYLITLIALGVLAGCATAPPPPLTADDPASPSATKAPVRTIRNALGTDGLTRKTRQILAQAAKEQQQSNQSGQVAGDRNGEDVKNMPDLQPPQQQQMPGMQMPQGPAQSSPTPGN
jgi:hypothetical protein